MPCWNVSIVKSKKQLAITLSQLKLPDKLNVGLEQYITPSEIAADMVWTALPDLQDGTVADFGCGNGILGIGASLVGAKKVFLLDTDKNMLALAKQNANSLSIDNAEFVEADVSDFYEHVDVVIQNPPFGIQSRKADKPFIETALQSADVVYSLHAPDSEPFLLAIAKEYGFTLEKLKTYDFVIGHSYHFHTKPTKSVKAVYWRFSRM